ncbi:MAG: hypothetical protein EOP51_03040, partial [Sphingobacteriales bacterium]
MKKLVQFSFMLLALLPAFMQTAKAEAHKNRMNIVIDREKGQKTFTPVSNVWYRDNEFDASLADAQLHQ